MNEEKTNINPENENNAVAGPTTEDYAKALNEAHGRIVELEKELTEAKDKAASASKYQLQYYRQVDILKKMLRSIMEAKEMKIGDVYEMLLESNDIDLDTLLVYLSK